MLPTSPWYPTHFQKGDVMLRLLSFAKTFAWTGLSHVVAGSLISLANGQMKKVEELQTEDFISSAKTNRDVFLDHSTLIKIENQEKSPNVTLTFSVGKDNIEVRM